MGKHRIQGISDEFIPSIIDLESLDQVVATVFPDDNKKYLSTDLLSDETVKEDYLSKDVDLLSYRAFKRVCHTCCDPDTCVERNFKDISGFHLPHCARRTEV